LVGATLLALGLGEIIIRVSGSAPEIKALELADADCVYRRSTNPVLGFELKPNYRADDPDFISSYERTNAHGLRDRERSLQKPEGTRRILLLGDSVVEGHGLPEIDTISHQWEALYEDGATEVLNFGISAYCTLAEIELLETKGLGFDPDVVVVLFVENDFDNFNREAFALPGGFQRPPLVEGLLQHSHFFRLGAWRMNWFHLRAEADPVRWNREAIGENNVVQGFQRLRSLADREGFLPLVVIWPRFLNDAMVNPLLVSENDPAPVAERLAALHGLPSARLAPLFREHLEAIGEARNPRLTYTSGDELHPSALGASVAASGLRRLVASLEAGELEVKESPSSGAEVLALAKGLGWQEPNYGRVYHQQGVTLLQQGKYEAAIAQFAQALEEDPGHAGAHGNMGLAFERRGDRASAMRCYQQAIEVDGDFIQGHFNLARLRLEQEDPEPAIASLRRVLEIDPDHTDALNLLGMELGKARQFNEALTLLQRAVTLEPDFSEAHNNLGTIYAATGQWEKSLAQFQEAVRADPANEGAASRLKQVEQMVRARRASQDASP
jgi:tetratricopeptide (TPR) repeat protein